jgi:hypothetical protein
MSCPLGWWKTDSPKTRVNLPSGIGGEFHASLQLLKHEVDISHWL